MEAAMKPVDAYREGYEKARKDDAGGVLAEITMGILRDHPGGYFAAGYHDGAAGKKFAPPSEEVRKPAAELNPFDDKVAIKTVCPNCGALDWYEWKFLGKLTDPFCGHTWYAGSGTYSLMQLRAAFQAGSRFTKYLTSGISGEGAWIAKALGWVMGSLLGIGIRLEFGLLMTPIQAIVGLCQPQKSKADIISRSIFVGIFVVALGVFAYEIQQGTRVQPVITQQARVIQGSNNAPPRQKNVRAPQVAILGKWYPTESVPLAIRAGYVFLKAGKLLIVPYRDVDGSLRPDNTAMKGTWSIRANVLQLGANTFTIIRQTRDQLVLDSGAGSQIVFSRNAGRLTPFNAVLP
jgi:hypothetical protein